MKQTKLIKGLTEADYKAILNGTKKLSKDVIANTFYKIKRSKDFNHLSDSDAADFALLLNSKNHSCFSTMDLVTYYKNLRFEAMAQLLKPCVSGGEVIGKMLDTLKPVISKN